MKSISKKLIISLMVFLILFNFMIGSVSKTNFAFAATSGTKTQDELIQEAEDESQGLFEGILTGIVGVINWILRLQINIPAVICNFLSYFIIDAAGHGTNEVSVFVSPFDIFFNKFTLTNINIFQTDDLDTSEGSQFVKNLRQTVAMIYYIVRAIAIGILLIIFLILVIKLGIATLAEEKARIKQRLVDWVISFALVLFMHLIVMAIIYVNQAVITMIESAADSADISTAVSSLRTMAFSLDIVLGWGASIAYFLMTIQTMMFVLIYIKRLFIVIILIVLSPIMPLTYSIDRAKGGGAKALNGWLREICYNVFIQIVHCLIYVAIIGVPLKMLGEGIDGNIAGLAESVLLIMAMLFVRKAEKLIMSLFGFDQATTLTTVNSTVNSIQRAVATGVTVVGAANGVYIPTGAMTNNTPTFGNNVGGMGNAGEIIGNKVHEYKDRAGQWLKNQEQAMGVGEGLRDIERGALGGADGNGVIPGLGGDGSKPGVPGVADGMPLPFGKKDLSDEDAKKVADAVNATKHEDEESKTEQESEESKTERIGDYEILNADGSVAASFVANNEENNKQQNEFSENSEHHETEEHQTINMPPVGATPMNGLPDKKMEGQLEFKEQYDDILEKLAETAEAQREIKDKLDELGDKLGKEKTDEIFEELKKKQYFEGDEAVEKYVRSLGDTDEGRYARLLVDNRGLIRSSEQNEKGLVSAIKEAYEKGLISSDQMSALMDNSTNVINGGKNNISEIIKTEEVKDSKEHEEVEHVEGDVTDITDSLGFSPQTVDSVVEATRNAAIANSQILDAIDGDIKVEGDFNHKNLVNFNMKIMEKAKAGAYSESNFKKAEARVKKEGDVAVKRLEKFKKDQSEANARMLTAAGKDYAKLMVEAQQAGMFIVSAGMNEKSNTNEFANVSSQISQEQIRRAGNRTPEAMPSNRSGNVVNDLNNKRRHYA